MEHSGTSRNIPEHGKMKIIFMKKILIIIIIITIIIIIFVKINKYRKITKKTKKKERRKKKLESSPGMRKQYFIADNLWGKGPCK